MNSLKSLQVLCSGVAHFAECSQSKVDRISIFSGTLTINFSPLKIDRRTSCAPHGPVKFWQPRERKRGLLVSLILGCFIKILHQIWNNKRFCGKLIESGGGGGAYPSVQMTLRGARAQFRKSVFIRNMITGVMQSQFFAHLSPTFIKIAMCMTYEALTTTESSCKN